MPGRVPDIHAFSNSPSLKTWRAGTRSKRGPAKPDPRAGHDGVGKFVAFRGRRAGVQPRPIPLNALLIQEPVSSLGSTPPLFTSL